MTWLSRFLWLAAWGVWLWLGVGLYRELPRQAGPRLCRIPIGPGEAVLGFVKNAPLVVVQPRFPTRSTMAKVFDVRSGFLAHEISFDGRWPILSKSDCRSHGVAFAHGRGTSSAGLAVVDFATGAWATLSDKVVMDVEVHPKRPWVAFRESAPPIDNPRRLVVVDFTNGEEVFLRPADSQYLGIGRPLFVGDSDRLVIPIRRATSAPEGEDATDLEVWRLAAPAEREKVIRNVRVGYQPQTTTGGRIAWISIEGAPHRVDVFDLDAERVIDSTPLTLRDPNTRYTMNSRFRLSSTGRSLMCIPPTSLWNIETGEMLWSSAQESSTPGLIDDSDLFEVEEHWNRRAPALRLGEWRTAALYNLDAALLQFRCWMADAAVLRATNLEFTLGANDQGVVHRLPFQVNWPLLVLCQTILALPLLLVWLILDRRRRNAARRQSMATPP